MSKFVLAFAKHNNKGVSVVYKLIKWELLISHFPLKNIIRLLLNVNGNTWANVRQQRRLRCNFNGGQQLDTRSTQMTITVSQLCKISRTDIFTCRLTCCKLVRVRIFVWCKFTERQRSFSCSAGLHWTKIRILTSLLQVGESILQFGHR